MPWHSHEDVSLERKSTFPFQSLDCYFKKTWLWLTSLGRRPEVSRERPLSSPPPYPGVSDPAQAMLRHSRCSANFCSMEEEVGDWQEVSASFLPTRSSQPLHPIQQVRTPASTTACSAQNPGAGQSHVLGAHSSHQSPEEDHSTHKIP